MADDAHMPVFWVRDTVLAAFKHAAAYGKTPDGSDPWIFLSDTVKSHRNLYPNIDGPEDQVEFVLTMASAAAGMAAVTVLGLSALSGPFAPVVAGVLGTMGVQPRTCRVIVVNDTDEDLSPPDMSKVAGMDATGVAWLDCGVVRTVPAVATSTGGWTALGTIPKRRVMRNGSRAAGVGCYVFQKNLTAGIGLYGTGGVLPYTSPSMGADAAVGWLVPQKGSSSTAVTLDLNGDGGAATLYDKYVDKKRQTNSYVMGGAAMLFLQATLSDAAASEATLTACFEPLQPQT